MGFSSFMAGSNSLMVVSMIQGSFSVPWRLDNTLKCLHHLIFDHRIHITHVYREVNQVADSLANLSCRLRASSLFLTLSDMPCRI